MNRTNMWLTVVLAVQVVIFGFSFAFCGSSNAEKAERVLLLRDLARDGVSKITLEDADGQLLKLALSGEKWLLPAKSDYPADEQKVNRLLSKLFGLESSYVVSTGADHHRKLEVAENKFRKKVTLESKEDKRVLLVGNTNADNFVSMRAWDDPKVFAIDGIKEWDLGTQVSEWAENPYLDIATDRVSGLELVRGDNKMALERQRPDKWMFDGKPVDASKVNSWLGEVATIQITDVLGKVEGSDELMEKMKKKKHQLRITLRVEQKPLEPEKPGQDPSPEAKDTSSKTNPEEASAGQKPPPEMKTISIAAGSDDDQEVLVVVEGQPFLVKVDRWRMREILEAGPKKLTHKTP